MSAVTCLGEERPKGRGSVYCEFYADHVFLCAAGGLLSTSASLWVFLAFSDTLELS